MDERVWVGPTEHTPPGWVACESVEAFLASAFRPVQIVIDDRAAALREADFVRLFEHSPLARIDRIVGPWRAGIGRTDPVWPLGTTVNRESKCLGVSHLDAPWRPLTGGYDELAAVEAPVDLSGITITVRISDPELRAMWIDWLGDAGAELRADPVDVDVLIEDGTASPTDVLQRSTSTTRWIVHLRPDPWNSEDAPRASEVMATESFESFPVVISVSVLDSPHLVMRRIATECQRGAS